MPGRVVCIGECMVEFAPVGGGTYRLGFAGDTFNTAYYLRQLLPRDWRVEYVTAVGDDAMSAGLLAFMQGHGIGTEHVRVLSGQTPGLYVISVAEGERSFAYWRGQSAARHLAEDAEHLASALGGADVVYFSGITLAILPEADRRRLLGALEAAKGRGATIVFDPNIRPKLWSTADEMRHWVTKGAAAADIVLPSFDDESAHFGDEAADATVQRYLRGCTGTVVVKNGENPVNAAQGHEAVQVAVARPTRVQDTTAAGDSFNAGFIAGRLAGLDLREAIEAATSIAGIVISQPGAIVRDDEFTSLGSRLFPNA